jgi:hypothetical protein
MRTRSFWIFTDTKKKKKYLPRMVVELPTQSIIFSFKKNDKPSIFIIGLTVSLLKIQVKSDHHHQKAPHNSSQSYQWPMQTESSLLGLAFFI